MTTSPSGRASRAIRVGLVGLGAAGREIHLPAIRRVARLSLVGGCDPVAPHSRYRFPVYATLDELLERGRPDIVVVATPPDSHFELVRRSLKAGCHVLCEKPFVETLEQARELYTLSRSAGRFVVVNNQYRFMRIHQAARTRVGSEDFGELLFLSAHQSFLATPRTESGWRGHGEQRTCREFGTHVLDLCRFFFDEDPRSVRARMPRPGGGDGPDLLNLIELEFSADRVAHVTLDRLSHGSYRYLSMRLDGSRACIETEIGGRAELAVGVSGRPRRPFLHAELSLGGRARILRNHVSRRLASDPLDLFAGATARLWEAFLDHVERGIVPPCHAGDNGRTLAVMLAAYESAERGVPVEPCYDGFADA